MLIYVSAFALSMVFGYFAERIKKSKQPKSGWSKLGFFMLVFLCFAAICLPSAVRYNVGTDYEYIYVPMLNSMRKSGVVPKTDLMVRFFFWLVYTLNLSNQWFFVLTSIYINAFVVAAIFVNKKSNVIIALGIYFLNCVYFTSMSNIRQMMGMATILLAFSLLANGKTTKNVVWGLILALISALCHPSCWISSALFVFCLLPLKVKNVVPPMLVFIVLSPVLSIVVVELLKLTRYAYFFDSFGGYGSGLGALGIVSPDIVLWILTLWLVNKKKIRGRILIPFMLMKTFSLFAYVLTLFRSMELFIRLYHIFYAFDIIYVPILMDAYMSKNATLVFESGANKIDGSLLKSSLSLLFMNAYSEKGGPALSLTSTRTFASDISLILPLCAYALSFFVQEIISSYYDVLPYYSIWG